MTLLEITTTFSDDQLKDLWCDLNVFRWPALWPDELRPNWWTNANFSERKQGFITPFMHYCRDQVGQEIILEHWRKRQRILPMELSNTIT